MCALSWESFLIDLSFRTADKENTMSVDPHILSSAETARKFILAGKAFFTVRNPKTGNRFTYKVKAKPGKDKKPAIWFVSVLTGSNNTEAYTFLGTIFKDGHYRHSLKSSVNDSAMSAKAFDWVWKHVGTQRELTHGAELWHSGKCGCCGRKLTVPESISTGIGPICAERI